MRAGEQSLREMGEFFVEGERVMEADTGERKREGRVPVYASYILLSHSDSLISVMGQRKTDH